MQVPVTLTCNEHDHLHDYVWHLTKFEQADLESVWICLKLVAEWPITCSPQQIWGDKKIGNYMRKNLALPKIEY